MFVVRSSQGRLHSLVVVDSGKLEEAGLCVWIGWVPAIDLGCTGIGRQRWQFDHDCGLALQMGFLMNVVEIRRAGHVTTRFIGRFQWFGTYWSAIPSVVIGPTRSLATTTLEDTDDMTGAKGLLALLQEVILVQAVRIVDHPRAEDVLYDLYLSVTIDSAS